MSFIECYQTVYSNMSIAEEEKRINGILTNSRQRLTQVQDELSMFRNEKQSIEEDIAILTQRAQVPVPPLRT